MRSKCPSARLALFLTMLIFLGACRSAVQPEGQSIDERPLALRVADHQAAVQTLEAFRVRGGIGVWNDTESSSARMDWQQATEFRDIALSGPAGMGSLRLRTFDDGRSTLQVGQNREIPGQSADALLKQVLGLELHVPLDQLSLWIRGLPGEASGLVHDAEGRLQSLLWQDEQGIIWRANIKRYTSLGALPLPSLVTARGAGYRLRIVLKDWEAAPISGGEEDFGTDKEQEIVQPLGPGRLPIPGRQSGVANRIGSRRG